MGNKIEWVCLGLPSKEWIRTCFVKDTHQISSICIATVPEINADELAKMTSAEAAAKVRNVTH